MPTSSSSLLLTSTGMIGDIWSTGAFSLESSLRELLDSIEPYTLEQLLAEDELLQELRGMHKPLLEFCSTPESVTKMVQYVITPQEGRENEKLHSAQEWLLKDHSAKTPENDPELRHIRFPYMSCEIICCEIQSVIDVLVDGYVPVAASTKTEEIGNHQHMELENGETNAAPEHDTPKEGDNDKKQQETPSGRTRILDLLFSVLYDTPPGHLDDYRAGYFEKILTVLFRRRQDALTEYINSGGGKGASTLMQALLKHLYSHSVMQIAQRLLLPPRPTPPKQQHQQEEDEEGGTEIMSSEEQELVSEEAGVKCDWPASGEALDLLLESLVHPVVAWSNDRDHNDNTDAVEEIEERRLALSLNASEVLITIIQNSMLSSDTMLSLTSSETIRRLVEAATTLNKSKDVEEEYFSPHESLLTSAMNVLESLILQLGGYGAVGTMFLLPEEGQVGSENAEMAEGKQHLIADLGSMVEHLPYLLERLSKLLLHPSTQHWTSPTQYSKSTPQQLLGSSRLRIVRVLESLVLLGDPQVDLHLVQSNCLEICLDFFWEFQWCSMLHQSVANLLVHVFEGQNTRIEMQEYFLIQCNLLKRLLSSFTADIHDSGRRAEVVTNLNEMNNMEGTTASGRASSTTAASGSDPLLISEDDVDAALEKQEDELVSTEAVRFDSREPSTIGAVAPPPENLRMGYMGHVIIICQALVHACSSDEEEERLGNGEVAATSPYKEDITEGEEPLLLAELVAGHALAERWNEFVTTTLAAETAIQSCPLGGYSGGGNDHLLSHRPGLADDGDIMGDDGMGPPAPPRGMLGDGDYIDMDDNDLEVAASIMASLNLKRDDDNSADSGSGDSFNSGGESNDPSSYAFDDPLGKAGALGIELDKLTKYRGDDDEGDVAGKGSNSDDENDSSSDEEPDRGDNNDDVPVMDLFAGNFDLSEDIQTSDFRAQDPIFSADFADFEQANTEFGEFESAPAGPPAAEQNVPEASLNFADEIFGTGDHVKVLEEETVPISQQSTVAEDAATNSALGLEDLQAVEDKSETTSHEMPLAEDAMEEPAAGPGDHQKLVGETSPSQESTVSEEGVDELADGPAVIDPEPESQIAEKDDTEAEPAANPVQSTSAFFEDKT